MSTHREKQWGPCVSWKLEPTNNYKAPTLPEFAKYRPHEKWVIYVIPNWWCINLTAAQSRFFERCLLGLLQLAFETTTMSSNSSGGIIYWNMRLSTNTGLLMKKGIEEIADRSKTLLLSRLKSVNFKYLGGAQDLCLTCNSQLTRSWQWNFCEFLIFWL